MNMSIYYRRCAAFLITVALCLLLVGNAAAQSARSLVPMGALQLAVDAYGAKIALKYKGVDRASDDDLEFRLAAQQVNNSQRQDGLTLQHVNISTKVLKAEQLERQLYSVLADITTNLRLQAGHDSLIVIAGKKRNILNSVATDRHILTIRKEPSTKKYRVIKDALQDQDLSNDYESSVFMTMRNSTNNQEVMNRNAQDGKSHKIHYDAVKAAMYAEQWTETDRMNPNFPIYSENSHVVGNCTNFVSQSVYADGLPTTFGTSLDVWNDKVWTWNLAGIARASHTWSGAEQNYRYMKNYSGEFYREDPWRIGTGGIIYADWKNTGVLGHAMFVVGYAGHEDHPSPVICQKSVNRHDWLFSNTVATAQNMYHGKTRWVGLQSR